jgi:quercetin dioxygenase-like cupin family protein
LLTVEYLPGGALLPNRHDTQVFVYVLQGALHMQVAGSHAVTLRPGKILVFIVKNKGAPVSRDATTRGEP